MGLTRDPARIAARRARATIAHLEAARLRRARWVVVAGAICVSVLVLALVSLTRGQGRPSAALLLARTCVSERGWRTETDDCGAIHAVAVRRSEVRDVTLARAIVELSPRLHGSEPIPRPWVRHLMPDGRRPREWRRASWVRHREAWLATLAEARALVAGELPSPCAEPPSSWGSRSDVAIHLRADPTLRWVDVDCGNTRNRTGRYERRRSR